MIIKEKEIVVLQKEAQVVAIIKGSEDMIGATEFLSRLNKTRDDLVAEKEKVTKPLNEALKAERARFKPLEEKLDEAIAAVRSAMIDYQTKEKARVAVEAERIAARIKPGTGNLSVGKALEKIDQIDTPEEVVSTVVGAVQFRTVKKFEVMDIRSLPGEYLLANETMIREAMKVGKELDGVRYYTEEVPYNTR